MKNKITRILLSLSFVLLTSLVIGSTVSIAMGNDSYQLPVTVAVACLGAFASFTQTVQAGTLAMAAGPAPTPVSQTNPYVNPSLLQPGQPPSVGGNNGGSSGMNSSDPPTSFTLNATGTGANVKLQSADNTYESINGTLGAATFTVTELPDRAGLGYGGGTLLGVDCIRAFLLAYAFRVDYVNYQASASTQLANPLRFYSAGIDGTNTTQVRSIAKDLSNLASVATLQPVGDIPMQKHNTAFNILVANTVTVNLTYSINSIVPYTTWMGMGFAR